VRAASAAGALLQPVLFYPLWVATLLPLMAQRNQIRSLYSVFILDLCFIMPAFIVLAVLVLRNRGFGLVLLPALFVVGFTLVFSLAVAELVKPVFDQRVSVPALVPWIGMSLLFLVLTVIHLWRLRLTTPRTAGLPASPLPER